MDLAHIQTNGIDLGDLKAYYDLLGDESKAKMCSDFYNTLQPSH